MSKGYSLHIGLNAVDPDHYVGWDGQLNACEADAHSMQEIAISQGFESKLLLTQDAKRQVFLDAMIEYANKLQAGDIFMLTYSGHGGQIPDMNGDEDDGLDETWCLFDAQIIDDEIYNHYSLFKAGVRILVFSDSCHSGTVAKVLAFKAMTAFVPIQQQPVYRNAPLEVTFKTFTKNKDFYTKILKIPNAPKNILQASVSLFSGCQDNQLSQDGFLNGLFTSKLLRVWADGNFKGNYLKFYKKIVKSMNDTPSQTPNHFVIGPKDIVFESQKPFTI